MAVHLRVLLILTGLTGIHSITTVSEVSVKAEDSVSIPCLYASQYLNHVKYLCKGYYWSTCSYAAKTNQKNSEKFSISDDKSQRVFNVNVNDLTAADADYWCAVEINGGSDVGQYFHLSVTRGTPSLYVDHQEVTGFTGNDITINCYYGNSGDMRWCMLGGSCVTTSGSLDGTRVTINASVPRVFTVTMSGLSIESSGWYWCAKGDVQLPVHVTVTERSTTNITPTTVEGEPQSVSVDLKLFIIPLSVLIFIVLMTLFIWFMLKRHQQTKAAAAMTANAESQEDVTYSSVVIMRKQSVQRLKDDANEEDVTYSTLA